MALELLNDGDANSIQRAKINAGLTATDEKASADNVLELDNTTSFTPDADYEPATKKYVDDSVNAEDLWDRTGTTLEPKTAGDDIETSGAVRIKNNFASLTVFSPLDDTTMGLKYYSGPNPLGGWFFDGAASGMQLFENTMAGGYRFFNASDELVLEIDGTGYYTGGLTSYLDFWVASDAKKIILGAGKDASVQYDGSDLIIKSDETGSGSCKINTLEVRNDGTMKPVQLADAAAPNDSIYYSTTQSKLVYKDSGGTVNNLY